MKAELFNFNAWVVGTQSVVLKQELHTILLDAKFEILGFLDHQFYPQGYTAIWLLGESHLALHTFPEENKSYIELTSCVKEKRDVFVTSLKSKRELLQP
jgi:S-adenosylmethionine decarboxylase